MRRILHTASLLLCAAVLCRCSEAETPCGAMSGLPIVFSQADPSTRAFTETVSAAGFKCAAVRTGGAPLFTDLVTGVEGDRSTTGYYWPMNTSLTFYGVYPASVSMSVTASTARVTVGSLRIPFAGTTDIVAMRKENVAFGTSPVPVTFDHILACAEAIWLDTETMEEDYEVFITSAVLEYAGQSAYDLRTGLWTTPVMNGEYDYGAAILEGGESLMFLSGKTFIPGAYTITVEYEVTVGEETAEYVKSAPIPLVQGKRNTVHVTVPSGIAALEVRVSVKDWEEGPTYIENL